MVGVRSTPPAIRSFLIRDRVIVCIASAWDFDPTSKHQVMKILARENRVVWVNYHGSRRPQINATDARAAFHALRRCFRGVQTINDSMVQLTPLVIPGAKAPVVSTINQELLIAQIRRAVRQVDPSQKAPVQVWSFAPDVPFLAGRFGEECFVYYCVDEYTEFEGFDPERMRALEGKTLEKADVVFATAEELCRNRKTVRPDIVHVPHGVDFDHFAQAWRNPPPRPTTLAAIPRPIFGFFGLLHHWIDIELIAETARRRPHYSFVLIGDPRVDLSILRTCPNVYLLGRKEYDQLPAYCAAFDAAMMPFRMTELTRNVNPIKMYEYLAAGLPVVSTPIPEAKRFSGSILFGETSEQFAKACDEVLLVDVAMRRRHISDLVRNETWGSRVEFLSEVVLNHVNGRPRSLARSLVEPSAGIGRPIAPLAAGS